MNEITKIKLYKTLKIIYYTLETLILLTPILFIIIANFVEIKINTNMINNYGANAKKFLQMLLDYGVEKVAYWDLMKGWRFALIILVTFVSLSVLIFINWKRLLNFVKQKNIEIKNINAKNLIAKLKKSCDEHN